MRSYNQRRRYLGMTGRQVSVLAVLALLTFSVVIGGGYYILTDSGLIGERQDALLAQSDVTATMTFTSAPPPSATATPEETDSKLLPPIWTPTPTLTEIPLDTSSWTMEIEDLPDDFEETTLEELGLESQIYMFEGQYPLIDYFSYICSNDEFESIFGWTFLIEAESDQVDFDDEIQEMDLFSDEMRDDLNAEEITEQQELDLVSEVGNSARAITLVARIEDVDFRLDIIVFRRNAAGVFCATIYIDGDAPVIQVEELAQILDAHILEQ